ncbi:hypothetical protein RhiirA4_543105 [Rhizophagus irregularis]|uniref:Uncharacterized protein n=1 Tax=Rhizophagus irregularis TaxID=588596 RepID=A0A2I1GHM2_9GLOM|nr:hypothetical protein RhiirA4_543105 [Rhizophagus irregularis]
MNNSKCYQKPEFITSNAANMNGKYKFSNFLTSLCFTQEFIPSRARRKYFERIRTLLSQQYEAIEARKRKSYKDISEKSNRKTKTFFRFSYRISKKSGRNETITNKSMGAFSCWNTNMRE